MTVPPLICDGRMTRVFKVLSCGARATGRRFGPRKIVRSHTELEANFLLAQKTEEKKTYSNRVRMICDSRSISDTATTMTSTMQPV
jgi:hypothetical protein